VPAQGLTAEKAKHVLVFHLVAVHAGLIVVFELQAQEVCWDGDCAYGLITA